MTNNGSSRIDPYEGSGDLNIHHGIVYYDNTNYYLVFLVFILSGAIVYLVSKK